MKSTIDELKARRSCRSYEKEQIKEEELLQILDAGIYAPTGMGAQSPIMIAIQDQETIKELSKINASVMGSDSDPFYGAPTVIAVLADTRKVTYKNDGSLVMGNLMNAAHSISIGSCWIHRAKETFESDYGKELLKKLTISGDFEGIAFCVLGYAVEEAALRPRKENYIYRIK
ncbi:MAG: nitroreductase family protein [Lachnospiraceae bacterium]